MQITESGKRLEMVVMVYGANGKELPASAGDIRDIGSISGSGRSPGTGHGNPLQYSYRENPHGQRSPWGRKESDTTEVP